MIPVLQWRYASGQTEENGCKSCRTQDGTADLDQARSARFEGALQGKDARDCYLQRDEAHCRGSSPAGAQARNQLGSPALTALEAGSPCGVAYPASTASRFSGEYATGPTLPRSLRPWDGLTVRMAWGDGPRRS